VAQTIIVPIRNLKLYRQIKIGNVLFIKSAKSVKKDQPYYNQIKEMISIKEEDKKLLPEGLLHAKKSFRDCSLAVYTSDHDENKEAREDAQKNIECSLNVLRFYLSRTMGTIDPIFLNIFMAMEGLAYTGFTVALGIRPDGTTHTQAARTGYVRSYEITAEIMREIKKRNLDKLNKILLKPEEKRSPFEKNLLTSIDFYGNGMNEYTFRNRFVSFMISLESLLLVEREVRAVLAERAAMILGISSDGRKRIDKRISDLYEIRSKIVHEGKDEVTLNDIRSLSSTVFEIILKLINYSSNINDKYELRQEVNKLKYSATAFET
jgi:hypothetical protein